jgi:hypothetical protein
MSAPRYFGSRPHEWLAPRPQCDASQRYHTYGPIQPMDQPGILWQLFRRG